MWKVTSTIHTTLLALHVASGVTGLLIAPAALAAPKRRGRHTRLGYAYLVAVTGVCASAVGLAALHWSRLWWLAAIGVATEAAALTGLVVRLRRPPGWVPLHVSFMCGSYVSLVTAFARRQPRRPRRLAAADGRRLADHRVGRPSRGQGGYAASASAGFASSSSLNAADS